MPVQDKFHFQAMGIFGFFEKENPLPIEVGAINILPPAIDRIPNRHEMVRAVVLGAKLDMEFSDRRGQERPRARAAGKCRLSFA